VESCDRSEDVKIVAGHKTKNEYAGNYFQYILSLTVKSMFCT
jgi:hypothetical protein